MRKLLKCPGCQAHLDVVDAEPGAVVSCPSCNSKVRVPTGKTGAMPAVAAPQRKGRTSAAMRAASRSRTATEEGFERRYPAPKKSNTGLIVAGCIVALVALVVVIAVAAGGQKAQPAVVGPRIGEDPGDGTPVTNRQPEYGGRMPPADTAPPPTTLRRSVISKGRVDMIVDGLGHYGTTGTDVDFSENPQATMAWGTAQEIGKDLYPYLIVYIAEEDPRRARGAIAGLIKLSGAMGLPPMRINVSALQAEWKSKLGVSEEDYRQAEAVIKGQ
jgi:hypothetical protein